MATKINVDINVSDNGTAKKSTDAAERLKKTYDAAAKSASKIGGSPTMAGAASRASSSAELVEYNRNRALSTGTGASARDFAKQAEGLGGLVRLYATFAANVFAVSAAFGALSSAMDTTNMIRGLDQLGSATGVNLGGLSKKLVETTGHAVSLREAMEATVKASAAGIDSSSILRLGKVAQQASVALGVNAADALNRLSRGVVKLEPELLDELGIFTKIDPAVKKYAESVNKAVSELTDFERRQAFLNAVIEEGEQKFSQIEIDTNPYTKLSAALQNTLQNALELINKGLGPIANFLSESPNALTAALVGLGTVLVKQALPAIGQVKAGLAEAAAAATEKAQGKAGEALAARSQLKDLLVKQVELATDEQINIVDKAEERLLQIKNGSISKQSAIYKLLKKDIADVEEADINAAKAQAARISVNNKARAAEKAALNDVISGVENWKTAHEQETKTRTKQLEDTLVYKKVIKDAREFEIKATKDAIISNVAYNASLLGTTSAMQLFKMEVAASGLQMGKFATATLTARAAMAALAGAASTFVNVLGRVLFVIGIVTTAWSLLSGFFTTKELSNFSSEIDTLNTAAENLGKTFEKTAKSDAFSESSLKARASALIEFSQGLENTAESAQKALKSLESSKFARYGNNFLEFLGLGGVQSNFVETFTGAVTLALKEIDDPQLRREAANSIGNLLNIPIDPKSIDVTNVLSKALAGAKPTSTEIQSIVKIFKDIAIEAGNSASRITEVKNALDDTRKSFNNLQDSYKVKNPIIEYAENGIKGLEKLQTAIKKARTPGEAGEAIRIARELQASAPVLGNINTEELQKRIDEITRQGITGPMSEEQISAVLLRAFNTEGGPAVTSAIAQFNELIRKQLAVEKKKNENAFKEFALSLTQGLDARTLALEVSKAQAELEKVRSEFELAQKGTTPLTSTQKEGFQQKIQAANNAVLIAQTKEKLAKEKDTLATATRLSAIQKTLLEKQKAATELRALEGYLTEEGLVRELARNKLDILRVERLQKLDELKNREIILQIQTKALRDAGYTVEANITEAQETRLINFEREKVIADNTLTVKKTQVNTDLQLLDIAVRTAQQMITTQRLTEETEKIKAQSNLASRESNLDVQTRTNKLSREDLLTSTKQLALDKIAQKEKEDLQNAAAEDILARIDLGKRLSKASLENNKQEQDLIIAQIAAQNEKYNALIASIKGVSEASRRGADLDIGERRTQLLQNELDLRRQIEDIVRGGTSAAEDTLLNIEEEALELKRKTLRLDQEIYITEKAAIAQRRNALDFERQRLAAVQETTRQIEDSENRKKAGGNTQEVVALENQRQAALGKTLDNTLANLDQQEDSRQRSLKTATALEQIELRNTRADAARTVLDLENQIAQVRNSSLTEYFNKQTELLRKQNKLTADEISILESRNLRRSVSERQTESLDSLFTNYAATRKGLVTDLARALETGTDQAALDNINARIQAEDELYKQKQDRIKDNSEAELQLGLLDIQKRYNDLIKSERDLRIQINAQEVENSKISQDYNITIQETKLEALKQIGAIEESRYVQLKNSLELEKLSLDLENRKRSVVLSSVREIQASQDRITAGGLTPEQVALEIDLQNASRTGLSIALSTLKEEGDVRAGILNITGKIAVADAKRAEDAKKLTDQYKEMADAAKLIGDVFDGFGDRFAETVGGLSDVLQTDLEKRNALEKEYEQKRLIAAEKYRNNESKSRQELLKLQGENADKSLALDAEVVSKASGSFKSLFKEKTAAYKAFSLVEKAAAITTFALNAQIIASNLATLASRVSAGVAQLFAQGGFAGFAASAAFLALMGSLGIFGGKSVKNKAGPSTEDVQKAQTTGQSFQGGVLTARRGALSADPTKTLESIDESLEILKTNSFEELDFSNKNLKTLSNIERNTKGLSEALAIFALSASGNVPTGSKTSGPFGFGSGVLGKGLSLASGALGAFGGFLGGTAGASYLRNLLLNTFGSALAGIASPLTNIITSAFGPVGAALGFLLGKNLDKVLNSVFGGKTTKTLKDVTLTIDGQLNKLSEANSELIKTFAVLQVKIDGGWFRSDKIFDELFQLETPDLVKEYVGSLFKDIKTGIEVAGSAFGMDVTKILETSLTDPIKISLKDLKPEEIAEALKNQVSIAFNQIALAGFEPLIKALRDPLEEAGTTLTRLSSQVTLFDQAMALVSKSVGSITGTLKVVVADDLIELVGGVESFQERISFFRENFLSEAEQISPIAEALAKELEALGVSGNLSKDQFKALVLSQDLTTDSGRSTFAALLNVAEAFDKVTSAAEEAQSKLDGFVKDIRDFIREQTLDLATPSQTTQALFQEFGSTVSKSLQGDENSLSYLPDIASQTIESARNSSASLREFNKLRAGILGSLGEVASKIESGDLKILTPQEQSNVLLEQIVDNTGSLASDLAKEIDRQARVTAAKADLLSNPEKLQAAITASVVEASDFGSSDVPVPQATLDFLAAEEKAQKEFDSMALGGVGPRDARMAAVEQIVGLITPGASAVQLAGDLIEGKSLSEALAAKVDKISLENLGIKAPSLDAIINGISEGAQAVQLAGTYVAAQAANVIQAAKNTVNSLIDAVSGGSDSSSGLSAVDVAAAANSWAGAAAFSENALGGAFNKGIKMFETGGAFTNSVISNPTMFPLGVMGEAGPEAIMPLTRTSDGSLGVEATIPLNATMNRFNAALLQEVKELKKEIEKVRVATEVSATGTNKTYRLLDRVTENGDAFNVVVVTA